MALSSLKVPQMLNFDDLVDFMSFQYVHSQLYFCM